MLQPVGLALALALFVGAAARAEAAPSRTKRDRPVTVTGNPAEPLPEIHVAADIPTVLLFPAPILTKTITVDQSRIRVRDADESSTIIQAVEDYRPGLRTGSEVGWRSWRGPGRKHMPLSMAPLSASHSSRANEVLTQHPPLRGTCRGCGHRPFALGRAWLGSGSGSVSSARTPGSENAGGVSVDAVAASSPSPAVPPSSRRAPPASCLRTTGCSGNFWGVSHQTQPPSVRSAAAVASRR
ncbi:MAG: DUF2381 family protein, partial [Myxococcaceae bacterium]|nr:DUF2381 family protein [Myxococcaceae bacterium]